MRAHELARLLLNRPDGEVSISVDVSTCEEGADAERRAFGTVMDLQEDTNPADTVILCEGYLNADTQ